MFNKLSVVLSFRAVELAMFGFTLIIPYFELNSFDGELIGSLHARVELNFPPTRPNLDLSLISSAYRYFDFELDALNVEHILLSARLKEAIVELIFYGLRLG